MHDPDTVAWEIRSPFYEFKPWPKKARSDPNPFALKRAWEKLSPEQQKPRSRHWPDGYRSSLFTIWHRDPCIGGSDDSCGFGYIRLTKAQVEVLRNAAWCEAHSPHFLCCAAKKWDRSLREAESLYRGLYLLICRILGLHATWSQAALFASRKIHVECCDGTDYAGAFCFLPGYHTNNVADTAERRQDHFHGVLCAYARAILTERRPWYRHPRFHFWHWRIQWHFGQALYRWLFGRCAVCHKRFAWKDPNVVGDWHGTRIWHGACQSSPSSAAKLPSDLSSSSSSTN